MFSETISEPSRDTPIAYEAELCVIGGSCTGVFAAVRAARLGLKVALIENNSMLGGMAVVAQVNEWHTTRDTRYQQTIIGGLTLELMERLKKRGVVEEVPPPNRSQFRFNSAEMAIELDNFIRENSIRLFLNARCVAAVQNEGKVSAAIIEDKSGRRAIKAQFFIDASGDGDLLRHAGFAAWKNEELQPVNLQAITYGYDGMPDATRNAVQNFAKEFGYPTANSSPWLFAVPGAPALRNVFGPRVNGVDASDADQLTQALVDSRRYHRALCEMVEKQTGKPLSLVNFAPGLGVRETYHAECLHRLTADELLNGEKFPDSIANGTYPLDVHSESGTFLRYLDGHDEIVALDGSRFSERWRDEAQTPVCYHVPYRSLVPKNARNLLVAGRLIDAEKAAFGGVRVMVNCNQMGEAAGVAVSLAIQENCDAAQVSIEQLRATLAAGGSIVL